MKQIPSLNFNFPYQKEKTGMTVNLGQTKVLKTIPERVISADKIEIKYIVDLYDQKKVIAFTSSVLGQIILWEGDNYTQIGQWTDQDVQNRIIEILNITN
jgi:hypothetical protein